MPLSTRLFDTTLALETELSASTAFIDLLTFPSAGVLQDGPPYFAKRFIVMKRLTSPLLLLSTKLLGVTSNARRSLQTTDYACPSNSTGNYPVEACTQFIMCLNGEKTGGPVPCGVGYLFDDSMGHCNIENQVSCSLPTATPTTAPTAVPTAAPTDYSCPTDFTGNFAVEDCTQFIMCLSGTKIGGPTPCADGYLYDYSIGTCNVDDQVTCSDPTASPTATPSAAPTKAPTTASPTALPSAAPTKTPTKVPTVSPTVAPTSSPTAAPTDYTCPAGFTGNSPVEDCTQFIICSGGIKIAGPPHVEAACSSMTLLEAATMKTKLPVATQPQRQRQHRPTIPALQA